MVPIIKGIFLPLETFNLKDYEKPGIQQAA